MSNPFRDILVALSVCGALSAQSRLAIQGQPYASGDVTISVEDETRAGAPVLLAIGLDPLPLREPITTGKGDYYIGTLLLTLPLGVLDAEGLLVLPTTLPPYDPVVADIPLVLQAFVGGALSNPAALRLEAPYLLSANAWKLDNPLPTPVATYGDRVAVGDLDADGVPDLVVGARFEVVNGTPRAGRVYVHWGPTFDTFVVLTPENPKLFGLFGTGLVVDDFTGDGVDDLIVAESSGGDPPTPGGQGHLYLFAGGAFTSTPVTLVTSFGTAVDASIFGRAMTTGDFDDDGTLDFAIGTPSATIAGFANAGRIEIYWGPSYTNVTLLENPLPKKDDFFGAPVFAHDMNGDGISDLVESSGRAAVGALEQAGVAHVYTAPAMSLTATIDNPTPLANERFGQQVHAADLDGDGVEDIVLGSIVDRFYVAWGPDYASIDEWTKPPSDSVNAFGETAFSQYLAATDVDGDSQTDVPIADSFEGDLIGCGGLTAGGTLYVALGPYFATLHRIPNPFAACGDEFTWGLIAAQLDADRSDELISGADTADSGGIINSGQVIVIDP